MLTELQAVNQMLATIREAPVNTLIDPLTEEVSMAINTLRESSYDVQRMGWAFNTDKDVTFAPDEGGVVAVTEDIVRAVVDYTVVSTNLDLVIRGERWYDRKNHTYEPDVSIRCKTVIYFLDWDELPETARKYIAMRAARIFNARVMGSNEIERPATIEELRAFRELRRDQNDTAAPNLLNSPGIRETLGGRRW